MHSLLYVIFVFQGKDLQTTYWLDNKGNNKITEQSNKGKVKTQNYINRQNQSTTGKL
jgi:hypothetical protein